MTAALEGGWVSAARPGRSLPPGKTRYPFYRRLGGPQGQSGQAENLIPTGIRSRTVHPVVSGYTDWATRPTYIIYIYYTICNIFIYCNWGCYPVAVVILHVECLILCWFVWMVEKPDFIIWLPTCSETVLVSHLKVHSTTTRGCW